MSKNMTEAYNHEAEFDSRIAPHIHAIHEECKRLNLPMVVAVGFANEPREKGFNVGQEVAVNLLGNDRTPPGFYVAERVLLNDLEGAMQTAIVSGLVNARATELSREDIIPTNVN